MGIVEIVSLLELFIYYTPVRCKSNSIQYATNIRTCKYLIILMYSMNKSYIKLYTDIRIREITCLCEIVISKIVQKAKKKSLQFIFYSVWLIRKLHKQYVHFGAYIGAIMFIFYSYLCMHTHSNVERWGWYKIQNNKNNFCFVLIAVA